MDEAASILSGWEACAVAALLPSPDGRQVAMPDGGIEAVDAARSRPVSGSRQHVGDLEIAVRGSLLQSNEDLRGSANRALLLLPLQGSVEIVWSRGRLRGEPGKPLLLGAPEPMRIIWAKPSLCAFVSFPRNSIQAAASACLGDARRLAAGNVRAAPLSAPDFLRATVLELAECAEGASNQGDRQALEGAFYEAVVSRFVIAGDSGVEIFPRSRSVNDAVRLVHADHARPWSTDTLAAAVGVTGPTLRKNFKSSLGTSVSDFVSAVRLKWAHARLSSGHDARSIAQISSAAGYSSGTSFARAYLQRFGEAPSQTRGNAVRSLGMV